MMTSCSSESNFNRVFIWPLSSPPFINTNDVTSHSLDKKLIQNTPNDFVYYTLLQNIIYRKRKLNKVYYFHAESITIATRCLIILSYSFSRVTNIFTNVLSLAIFIFLNLSQNHCTHKFKTFKEFENFKV